MFMICAFRSIPPIVDVKWFFSAHTHAKTKAGYEFFFYIPNECFFCECEKHHLRDM